MQTQTLPGKKKRKLFLFLLFLLVKKNRVPSPNFILEGDSVGCEKLERNGSNEHLLQLWSYKICDQNRVEKMVPEIHLVNTASFLLKQKLGKDFCFHRSGHYVLYYVQYTS